MPGGLWRRRLLDICVQNARRQQQRHGLAQAHGLGTGPGNVGAPAPALEYAVRHSHEIEKWPRDLAHHDVLRGVLTLEAAPGHEQHGGQAVEKRKGDQRVRAGAEPRVLHDHGRQAAAEPGAGRQPERNVLADGRNVGFPTAARTALEGRDHAFGKRAGDTGEEVEALGVEEVGELVTCHTQAADKDPAASLAPSAAGSTYSEYASPADLLSPRLASERRGAASHPDPSLHPAQAGAASYLGLSRRPALLSGAGALERPGWTIYFRAFFFWLVFSNDSVCLAFMRSTRVL